MSYEIKSKRYHDEIGRELFVEIFEKEANAFAGALAGSAIGAGIGYTQSDKNKTRNALIGAGAGGLLGAGAGKLLGRSGGSAGGGGGSTQAASKSAPVKAPTPPPKKAPTPPPKKAPTPPPKKAPTPPPKKPTPPPKKPTPPPKKPTPPPKKAPTPQPSERTRASVERVTQPTRGGPATRQQSDILNDLIERAKKPKSTKTESSPTTRQTTESANLVKNSPTSTPASERTKASVERVTNPNPPKKFTSATSFEKTVGDDGTPLIFSPTNPNKKYPDFPPEYSGRDPDLFKDVSKNEDFVKYFKADGRAQGHARTSQTYTIMEKNKELFQDIVDALPKDAVDRGIPYNAYVILTHLKRTVGLSKGAKVVLSDVKRYLNSTYTKSNPFV